MGAEQSSIAAAYRLSNADGSPAEIPNPASGPLAFLSATHKATGAKASVFVLFSSPSSSPSQLPSKQPGSQTESAAGAPSSKAAASTQTSASDSLLEASLKILKTIRHPGLIKFIAGEARGDRLFVVTEPVQRLSSILRSMSEEEVCLGIYGILRTLEFLHSIGICHNNVHLNSVFVTQDRKWVLGNLEFARSTDRISSDLIEKISFYYPDAIAIPEDQDPNLNSSPSPARDCFAVAQLISIIIAPYLMPEQSQSGALAFAWRNLQDSADRMASRAPESRPSIFTVLDTPFFRNNVLIEVVEKFLKEIRAIPPELKHSMFGQLFSKLLCLPPKTVNEFLLPRILNHELFAEPGAHEFYSELFTPGFALSSRVTSSPESAHIITREAYIGLIVPFLKQCFAIRQFETRVFMLRTIDRYIDVLCEVEPDILESLIIRELVLGMDDADDSIYVLSVCALARITPRYCAILVSDAQPKIGNTENAPLSPVDASPKQLQQPKRPALLKRSASSISNTDESSPKFRPLVLVDTLLIPHLLRICISETVEPESLWQLLDSIAASWKRTSLFISKNKTQPMAAVLKIAQNLFKAIGLIMRVLPADQKIEFFCNRLCAGLDSSVESASSPLTVWIPKLLELAIPFLKDDNRNVRRYVSATVMKMVTLMTAELDRAPTISRKREQASLVSRMQAAYSPTPRSITMFPRVGPRIAASSSLDGGLSISDDSWIRVNGSSSSEAVEHGAAQTASLASNRYTRPTPHPQPHVSHQQTEVVGLTDPAAISVRGSSEASRVNISRRLGSDVSSRQHQNEDGWNQAWEDESSEVVSMGRGRNIPSDPDGCTETIGLVSEPSDDSNPHPVTKKLTAAHELPVDPRPYPAELPQPTPINIPLVKGSSSAPSPTYSVVSDTVSAQTFSSAPDAISVSSKERRASRDRYVGRDAIKKKREENHAQNMRRKSNSPATTATAAAAQWADTEVGVRRNGSSTPTSRSKIAIPVVQAVDIDYFKDMRTAYGEKQIIEEVVVDERVAAAAKTRMHGTSLDIQEISGDWGDSLDEDLDLKQVRL
eukprot:jgi/Hompol1/4352/HPOL_003593-RA